MKGDSLNYKETIEIKNTTTEESKFDPNRILMEHVYHGIEKNDFIFIYKQGVLQKLSF